MSQIKVDLVHEFKGEDVVLVAMDIDGLNFLTTAVSHAIQIANTRHSELDRNGILHVFKIDDEQSKMEITDRTVAWSLSNQTFFEVLEKLRAMKELGRACHHFVEISSPVETLLLSLDEH